MTTFHVTHHSLTRAERQRRKPLTAPSWLGRVAWWRIAGLAINFGLWAAIIFGVKALLRL